MSVRQCMTDRGEVADLRKGEQENTLVQDPRPSYPRVEGLVGL